MSGSRQENQAGTWGNAKARRWDRDLRAILDSIPDLAWLKDEESRFIAVNEALGAACGVSPEALVGKTDLDFFPKELAEHYRSDDREIMLSRRQKRVEEPLVDKSGVEIWIETIKTPIVDEEGRVVGTAGIARDITEQRKAAKALRRTHEELEELVRKRTEELTAVVSRLEEEIAERRRAEEAARESQRALSSLVSNLPGMVYRCRNTPEWPMDYVSERVFELTGHGREAFLSGEVQFGKLIVPEDRDRVWKEVQSALGERRPFVLRYRMRTKDGESKEIWEQGTGVWDASGALRGLEGFIQDVTEQHRAEEALRESEERFRTLFANVPVPVYCWQRNGSGFVLSDANIAADRITQGRIRQFFGMRAEEFLTGEDEVRHDIERCYSERVAIEKEISYRLRTTGELKELSVRYAFVPPDLVMVHTEDVTERKAAIEQAQRLRDELAHVGRVSIVGEMSAGLAHELNQPLFAISNYAGACRRLLNLTEIDPGRIREQLDRVIRQAERAAEIVKRVRLFVEKGETLRSSVDVNETIRAVMKLFMEDLRDHQVILRYDLGKGLRPVVADAIQIQQVVLNLARNAMEAMAEVEASGRELVIRSRSVNRGFVEVSVQDRGPGVSAEGIDDLFEAFRTTKPQGLGLGLSISRTIIEAHGGRLRAARRDDGGMEFCFTLPTGAGE